MARKITIERFLKELSSEKPTPGGGSAAALSGAIAAGLLTMAAKISGNKKIAEKSERFKKVLTKLIDEDAGAYEEVVLAHKLSKGTKEEKEHRKQEIEEALKRATEIPLQTARYGYEVMKLAEALAKSCNIEVMSDVGVAVKLAEAAVEGALLNVKVNLDSIKDEDFKKEIKKPIKEELYLAGCQARLIIQSLGERYSCHI